ncbi:type II secretion system protein N [Pelagimonas varians]|uniref:Type II secretion system protein GspC N-terminal domain-containing protein n=1 Tax=Pelagimonas varians TaxID=696760 RepID=A0A238L2V7_9RHOB|nr:type II secretion system protein N [Pelagimonas varians]PYG27236.1 Tfp pilus assembly protein PilP [Pelagimonas varians]SMX48666.1 hypothetical protein PEV8663_03899 [Pelagimonas varians]
MRWIGWIVAIVALAFAGQTGHALWLSWQSSHSEASLAPAPQTPDQLPPEPPRRAPRNWPSVFGEPQPPKPAPPEPVAEPQPPKPPQPPIDSLGYSLKGLVQTGRSTWAMVHHPTGEQLVRVGDMLAENIEVARIDDDGVWVSRFGGDPELLDFPE